LNETPTDSQWTRTLLRCIEHDILRSAATDGKSLRSLVLILSVTAHKMILKAHNIEGGVIDELFGVAVQVDPDETVSPFVLVEI